MARANTVSRTTAISDANVFDERCVVRRKQPTVEGRHLQVTGMTSRMRETRDRLQRVPQSARAMAVDAPRTERIDAVSALINAVPRRHDCVSFGKQQEQDPVHDRQGLFEHLVRSEAAPVLTIVERGNKSGKGPQHAIA